MKMGLMMNFIVIYQLATYHYWILKSTTILRFKL